MSLTPSMRVRWCDRCQGAGKNQSFGSCFLSWCAQAGFCARARPRIRWARVTRRAMDCLNRHTEGDEVPRIGIDCRARPMVLSAAKRLRTIRQCTSSDALLEYFAEVLWLDTAWMGCSPARQAHRRRFFWTGWCCRGSRSRTRRVSAY